MEDALVLWATFYTCLRLLQVLILVLMEDALVLNRKLQNVLSLFVLILVLMEDALVL